MGKSFAKLMQKKMTVPLVLLWIHISVYGHVYKNTKSAYHFSPFFLICMKLQGKKQEK